MDSRFGEKSVLFIEALIEEFLRINSGTWNCGGNLGWMDLFSRILIKDGTRFDLPASYASFFRGSGGSASPSGICIQFEFDLKTGKIHDLSTSSANVPDTKNAKLTKDKILRGDLILRDLGYFDLNIIEEMTGKGAYYISKLNNQAAVYEKKNGEFVPLDFKKLQSQVPLGCCIEKEVFVGGKQRMRIRLIIERVPDELYQTRVRTKRKQAKKRKYQPNENNLLKQNFNLYITKLKKRSYLQRPLRIFID